MARAFNGTSQSMATASAIFTTPPFSVMVDCVPADVTTSSAVVSGLAGVGNWDGHYLSFGTGVAKANTANSNSFTASSGVTVTVGKRQIITAVWTAASLRQCFCDKRSDTADTTSKVPSLGGPATMCVGAAKRGITDTFAALTAVFRVFAWNSALSFPEHCAIVDGAPPESIRPASLLEGFYLRGDGGSVGAFGINGRFGTLAPTNSPGLYLGLDNPQELSARQLARRFRFTSAPAGGFFSRYYYDMPAGNRMGAA